MEGISGPNFYYELITTIINQIPYYFIKINASNNVCFDICTISQMRRKGEKVNQLWDTMINYTEIRSVL
jgi:hypothetical protein